MPFTLRLTFKLNDPFFNVQHSFVYDGNPDCDKMKALGLEFETPLSGQVYNRHVLFSGELNSACKTFHESSKLLLSWHPKINPTVYPDQIAGKPLVFNPCDPESRALDKTLSSIPAWNSYRIYADSASHYRITKGTGKKGCVHISAIEGRRTDGTAVIAGEDGGIMVKIRDFWQKYPSSIWFENITKSETSGEGCAKTFVWLWSPESEAMNFSRYDIEGHSGPYYEGFDQSDSDPYGIANTNDILIGGFLPHDGKLIPSDEEISAFTLQCQKPSLLVASPEYYHKTRAFGFWSLPDSSTPEKALIEKNLDEALAFYKNEIEQRSWFGFWNYGDFMHGYDPARHEWKYDVGGFAWDNTELGSISWLWYSFLRTARPDIWRMAEAMTRHVREVDVYHAGPFAGLGSRHNVSHWGCGAKEARISQSAFLRFYYYLTGGDERTGDLMHAQTDADTLLLHLDPMRLAEPREKFPSTAPARLRLGPDWLAYAGNWFTEWERTGNLKYREKILAGLQSIAALDDGFFTGNKALGYDPATGRISYEGPKERKNTNHLATIMGGFEVMNELLDVMSNEQLVKSNKQSVISNERGPARKNAISKTNHNYSLLIPNYSFKDIWLDHALRYKQMARQVSRNNFPVRRLQAYAAWQTHSPQLAAEAWADLWGRIEHEAAPSLRIDRVNPPLVPAPIDEWHGLSTNDAALWSLDAIYMLEVLPPAKE